MFFCKIIVFIICVLLVKQGLVLRDTENELVNGFVGDGRWICSTKPSLLDDAFVHSANVGKNLFSEKNVFWKIKGVLFCWVIFAFCVKSLMPSSFKFFSLQTICILKYMWYFKYIHKIYTVYRKKCWNLKNSVSSRLENCCSAPWSHFSIWKKHISR